MTDVMYVLGRYSLAFSGFASTEALLVECNIWGFLSIWRESRTFLNSLDKRFICKIRANFFSLNFCLHNEIHFLERTRMINPFGLCQTGLHSSDQTTDLELRKIGKWPVEDHVALPCVRPIVDFGSS